MKQTFAAAALAAFVLTFALTGCTQPPPPDTRAADAQALRDVESANQKDWAAKDIEKLVAFYAEDATLDIPGMVTLNGKPAIRGALGEMLKDPSLTLSYTTGKAEASKGGDYGYTGGTYAMTMTDPKTKKIVTEKGKYVTVYKKQADGSWKAVADINNADAPAAPAR